MDQKITDLLELNTGAWKSLDEHFGHWMGQHLLNILVILFFTYLARRYGKQLAMRLIARTVRRDLYPTKLDRQKRVKTLQSLVNAFFQAGTWGIAILLIISELRPNYTGAIFASAGILGLTLGFGTQSLIKDFVSGIFIIIENQYRVGDTVQLGAVSGKVEAITIRTTVLRDDDGSVHHVPNGSISITTNRTLDYSRLNERLVISGDAPIETVEKVVNGVGEKVAKQERFAKTVKEPLRFVGVSGYTTGGDLIVSLTGRTTVTSNAQYDYLGAFYGELREAARKQKITFKAEK